MLSRPKSNSILTHAIDQSRRFITFTLLGAGDKTLDRRKVHEQNVERAEIHGFIQRVSDGAAIGRDPETGQPATPQMKFERICRIVDHLESGSHEWSLNRVGDGTIQAGYLFQALCIMHPKLSAEQVREWLSGMNRATQNELRKHPKVQDVIDEIKKSEPVDFDGVKRADDILSGLKQMSDAA